MDDKINDMMTMLASMKENMEASQNQLDSRLKALETAKEGQPGGSEQIEKKPSLGEKWR